jgi:hypothetical protein
MFCTPGFIFGRAERVGFRFHVLHTLTQFRRYRGIQVMYSCFAPPDSFSAITRASGPDFMFYAPGLVFGSNEGVVSCFLVLRARTHFRRYLGRLVLFSCFARSDSFSAVPRASGTVFMFCMPGLIFSHTEGVGSLFNVARSRTRFRPYRGRRVTFSCFVCPDSFSAVPRASVSFSCFARPESFSAETRASGLVFMFCAPGLSFGRTECVGSRFYVLRARTHFQRYRGR